MSTPYPNDHAAAKAAFILFHETDRQRFGHSLFTIAKGLCESGLHPDDTIEFLDRVTLHWNALLEAEWAARGRWLPGNPAMIRYGHKRQRPEQIAFADKRRLLKVQRWTRNNRQRFEKWRQQRGRAAN